MKCPSCGNESAPGAKFCESCGTPLAVQQTVQAPSHAYAQAPSPDQPQAPPQQQYGPQPQYGAQPYGAQPQYGPQPYGQPMYPQAQLKNGGIAAVLAFLFAGLGHIYLGLITKGIIYIIIMVVLWIVGWIVAIFTLGIGFLIPVIFWIWQIYDAYNKANQYNTALQQTGRAPW